MTTETFGKVKVIFTDCERNNNITGIKKEILQTVRDMNPLEYPAVIEEKKQFEFLYHLSLARQNAVRWLPITKSESVLEMNAQCGAITGAFVEMSDNVTAFCDCATDAEILAERFSFCKNLVVFSGSADACINEQKVQFDWIFVDSPNLFSKAMKLVKNNGRIVFAVDNRMGMRNMAGVKPYGDSNEFSGMEGKTDAGLTYAGMRKLLGLSGATKAQMYYPYPDYRFMKNLYSNARLPRIGELTDNDNLLYDSRLQLFSEKDAFDASCEDGSFIYYSNSYIAVIGPELNVEYARFSNDRALEYCIYTVINNINGVKNVRKIPFTEISNNHVRNMGENYKRLCEKYAGSGLNINRCNVLEIGSRVSADFEYVEGTELSKLLDVCLQKNDLKSFYYLFDRYVKLTGFNEDYPFANMDIVFSNILVNRDEWTLIDYEWCKEGYIPVRESAYRAIYCYLLEDNNRALFDREIILDRLGLSHEAAEEIEKDEALFQRMVTGHGLPLAELAKQYGHKSVNPIPFAKMMSADDTIYRFQVYRGDSTGSFSEENSYIYKEAYKTKNNAEIVIPITKDESVIRIDPLDSECLVTIREVKLGELDYPFDNKKYLVSNGKRIGKDTFVFSTKDPNLYFDLSGFIHEEETFLFVNLDIVPLANDVAVNISDNIKRLF